MTQKQEPMIVQLADWLEGRLTDAETKALIETIETDPALQAQVAWLRDFLQISQTTMLADPPAKVRQAATAAFAAYAADRRPPSLFKIFIASLTADNWQRPALVGARNVTLRSEPRQLIYNSDLADVALNAQMQASSGQIDLSGQIFPLDESDPADFLVQLLQDGRERQLTGCDALGKFSLVGLPLGTYQLLLVKSQAKIEIGPLELE